MRNKSFKIIKQQPAINRQLNTEDLLNVKKVSFSMHHEPSSPGEKILEMLLPERSRYLTPFPVCSTVVCESKTHFTFLEGSSVNFQ